MIDANKLLRAVVAVGGCYAVAVAAGSFGYAVLGWWALLLLALLAFYVVLAL